MLPGLVFCGICVQGQPNFPQIVLAIAWAVCYYR